MVSPIVDFGRIPAGAPNPTRVKFVTGFNRGFRDRRANVTMPPLEQQSMSVPFRAGYTIGSVTGADELSTEQLQQKLSDAWFAYVGANHGTDLRSSPELLGPAPATPDNIMAGA